MIDDLCIVLYCFSTGLDGIMMHCTVRITCLYHRDERCKLVSLVELVDTESVSIGSLFTT